MKILGIHQSGTNSSAALNIEGHIKAALLEERLSRVKFDKAYPQLAINECLSLNGITVDELDGVAIGWNPVIQLAARYRPGFSDWVAYGGQRLYSAIHRLAGQVFDPQMDVATLSVDNLKPEFFYVRHHLCHASTAFFLSPFEEAAYLTCDGYGEQEVITWGVGRGSKIEQIKSHNFPHSIGQFYSAMTDFLGFRADKDEWKVMGMAALGDTNRYIDKIKELIKIEEGAVTLDLSFFDFYNFERDNLLSPVMYSYLGLEPRTDKAPLRQEHFDLAAATQKITEEIFSSLLRYVLRKTGQKNLCLSGGSFLNSCFNGKILEMVPQCQAVFIPFCPDDAGNSIGSSLYVSSLKGAPRPEGISPFLGRRWSNEQIKEELIRFRLPVNYLTNPAREAARLVTAGHTIGWFQGAMEFGPRALGNRSILADVRDVNNREKLNRAVKFREGFRPFAAAVKQEKAPIFFQGNFKEQQAPFMEKVFRVTKEMAAKGPAAVHADSSCRIQTVNAEQNQLFYELLSEIETITGLPMVLNTSFNLNEEPIVNSPADALRSFFTSGLDSLFLGSYLLTKESL